MPHFANSSKYLAFIILVLVCLITPWETKALGSEFQRVEREADLPSIAAISLDGTLADKIPYLQGCSLKVSSFNQQELTIVDLAVDYPILTEGDEDIGFAIFYPASKVHLWLGKGEEPEEAKTYLQHTSQKCWTQRKRQNLQRQLKKFASLGMTSSPTKWLLQEGLPTVYDEKKASQPFYDKSMRTGFIKDGLTSLGLRAELIHSAKHSIHYKTFEFFGDASGRYMAEEMMRRKIKDDLEILVFIDAFPLWIEPNSILRENSERMFRNLMAAGIPVSGFSCGPLSQFTREIFEDFKGLAHLNYRYHEKALIADSGTPFESRAAIIGGVNTTNQYFRVGTEKWTDADVLVKGALVDVIGESFAEDWLSYSKKHAAEWTCLNPYKVGTTQYEKFWQSHSVAYLEPKSEKEKLNQQVAEAELTKAIKQPVSKPLKNLRLYQGSGLFVKNSPRKGQRFHNNLIERSYIEMINQAKQEIILANIYFIPSVEFMDALKEAVLRGVDIKILTNSMKSNSQSGNVRLSRFYYEALKNPYRKHCGLKRSLKQVFSSTYRAKRKRWRETPLDEKGLVEIFEFNGDDKKLVEVVISDDEVRNTKINNDWRNLQYVPEKMFVNFKDSVKRQVYRRIVSDRTGISLLHAKYAVFDRRYVTIGSFNLDPRSRNLSREHVVWVESEGLAQEFLDGFFEGLAQSQKVHPEMMHSYRHPRSKLEHFKLLCNRALESQY